MTVRREYELTDDQYRVIMEGIQRAREMPLIALNAGMPESPQEAANRLWRDLGREMGFDGMSVEGSPKGERFYTAIPVQVS